MDTSLIGWGMVLDDRLARVLWEGPHFIWHTNCIEMRAVFLKHFIPQLNLVQMDNSCLYTIIVSLLLHPLFRFCSADPAQSMPECAKTKFASMLACLCLVLGLDFLSWTEPPGRLKNYDRNSSVLVWSPSSPQFTRTF